MAKEDPTAAALAAASAAVKIAQASALRGDAEARLTYQLSLQILEGKFELMPALAALEVVVLGESLAAYTAVVEGAKATEAAATNAEAAAKARVDALSAQFNSEIQGSTKK